MVKFSGGSARDGRRRLSWAFIAWLVLSTTVATVVVDAAIDPEPADAGIFFNDSEFTYKEYWADHSTYTAGCGVHENPAGGEFYIEPDGCLKEIELEIPDDIDNAIAAVIYVDLWRNRLSRSARFTINDGPQYRPGIGTNFSRTPFQATVPLTQLQQGTNSLKFQEATGPYHVHDVLVRVYYDDANPIIPGPNSDVTPPSGQLTSVTAVGGPTLDPAVGGTLQVDGNQVILTADAQGAEYVEFHAFYDGFDEDNDGETRDWHNFLRNNFAPGGTEEQPNGATIGHIGTDSNPPYQVTWNLPEVLSQSGVKFKIRAVDASGNAVEAGGGVSADFTLERSYEVEAFTIDNFPDQALWFDGEFPQLAELDIDLPSDLGDVDRAILLGNYWNTPDLSINQNEPFPVFQGPEDFWDTSQRELDVSQLRPGSNSLEWNYRPPGFGAMIEGPGPMIVIHREIPSGPPVIDESPVDAVVSTGESATFSVAASGEQVLSFQWRRNGNPIVGATSSSYTTPALLVADDGATFDVIVTNPAGSVTSAEATVTVAAVVPNDAPWWDETWDYRAPLTVFPEGAERVDKVVDTAINFSELMTAAGAGGPTFDLNSIRVLEVTADGDVIGEVPFQFEPNLEYDPVSNAGGTLVWQLPGVTGVDQPRYFHTYFDKTVKGIEPAVVEDQVVRTDIIDQGFEAYQFDLTDDSTWIFHLTGGGWSSIFDSAGNDWIGWSPAEGVAGDFRGLPNAIRPPNGFFHPGRDNTSTELLFDGPLRTTFESISRDRAWITTWTVYPDTAEFAMTRANNFFWVQYEGTPGGEVDSSDQLVRSDGAIIPIDGQYEADLPGAEWMYFADTNDGRSFFMAHHQNDGAVESYRLLDEQLPIAAFGRGGLNLNSSYLERNIDGEPQRFTFGLAESTEFEPTEDRILDAYTELRLQTGAPEFNGVGIGAQSDGFSGDEIDPVWNIVDPVGDTTFTLTGSSLVFDIPEGPSHDLWEERDFAPRLLQNVGNDDLDVVIGFESVPTTQFQGQGLLFYEDENNWIRYSAEHDGTRSRVAVYQMIDGDAQQVQRKNLPGIATRFLRVVRSGDTWVFERSYNGTRYFSLPEINLDINMNQMGIVTTTHGSVAPAFAAEVDFFESRTSGTLNDDAPVLSNISVDAGQNSAVVTWDTNVLTDTRVDYGPTVNITERIVDTEPSVTHQARLEFLRCDTPYFFRAQSTSEVGSTVSDVIGFQTEPCGPVRSDDFSTGELADFWDLADPVGDVSLNLSDQNVVLSVPANSEHNLFEDENQAARLRQSGPIGDFEVEAKFETVLNKRFQLQGIVIEEDEDSFLRFEVHHDGSEFRTFATSVLNNVASNIHSGPLPDADDHYIRVNRTGNTWTMWHSSNGVDFTEIHSMVVDLESIYVGPYIGNTSIGNNQPPAVLGVIDYFFNTATPIIPEDGGAGPDTEPPVISDIVIVPESPTSQSATISFTTNEPSTTRADWGLTNGYGDGPFVDNRAKTSHQVIIEPLICGTTYHVGLSSNDAAGNQGVAPNQTFQTQACPDGPFSDNFDSETLDPRWFVDDPRGDSSFLLDGDLLSLSVVEGVRHDLTPNNNGALRVLQAVPNGDFVVEAGFESPVDFNFQLQGIVFEQDDDNLIRFDLSNDGTGTKAFVGILSPNNLAARAFVDVPGAAPSQLRVTRTGDTWTFEYSPDRGATYETIWTGDIDIDVARMGPFAGNANPQVANVPPHTALVDFFLAEFDPADPNQNGEDGGPDFIIFDGQGGLLAPNETLSFGTIGLTQPDINVRGRVTDDDGVRSITFSVNGSEPTAMGIGDASNCELGVSCTRRLALDGDINADVNSNLLNPGLNTVTLRAVDEEFNVSTLDVLVDYTPQTQDWPLPYSIDWGNTTDLYDVAQPIDGRWAIDGDELHIDEIGYDRLIGVGDENWSSFEAEVPITINSFDPEGYEAPSGGPGVGFIPHWRGHTQEDFVQPKFGFSGQLGALVWYRFRDDVNGERLEIRDSNAALVAEDLSGRTLTPGVTYIFKIQAETGGGTGPLYRLKVWEQGTPEPLTWDLITSLEPGAPDTGSLLLVAHHVDAEFGDLQVRQITADAPQITPESGDHIGLAKVELATGTPAGEIRFTLDGSEPTAESPLYEEPFFILESTTVKARTFRDGFIDSATTERVYSILEPADRIDDSLEALYRFDEGSGDVVADTAQTNPTPIDLVIEPESDVTWLPEQEALRINGPSVIRSAVSANQLNTSVRDSQGVSVEMWIDPATFDLDNGTLFNIAPQTPGLQNLALTQSGRALDIALRTARTDDDGQPSVSSGSVLQPQLHHVVYVMRPDNTLSVYVDSVLVFNGFRSGSLTAWAGGYGIGVANSVEGIDPWRGDLHLMAVYSSDLTAADVLTNYQAGPLPTPANFAPVVDAGSDITLVEGEIAQMTATASDDGNPIPPGFLTTTWTQTSGPATAIFADDSSPTSTVELPAAGTYEFTWTGDDGEKVTTDTMVIEVIPAGSQAPAPTIDPPTGSYPGIATVTIETTVPNADVRFTTDGSEPTAASPLFTDSFTVTESTTVRARTFRAGLVDSEVATSELNITIDSRVEDDLIALWDFNEANGDSIKDRQSSPLNLTVANIARTTRVDSGLRIDEATVIQSDRNASKINNAVRSSQEVTLEMWLSPADIEQSNAMIFGISVNQNARNLAAIQDGVDLDALLRSRATNTRGEPPTTAAGALEAEQMIHFVFTRDSSGNTKVYLDGVEVASGTVGNNLGNWISGHWLTLGAERNGTKPWLGTYYTVAIYDRALESTEVIQNFAFGQV